MYQIRRFGILNGLLRIIVSQRHECKPRLEYGTLGVQSRLGVSHAGTSGHHEGDLNMYAVCRPFDPDF